MKKEMKRRLLRYMRDGDGDKDEDGDEVGNGDGDEV